MIDLASRSRPNGIRHQLPFDWQLPRDSLDLTSVVRVASSVMSFWASEVNVVLGTTMTTKWMSDVIVRWVNGWICPTRLDAEWATEISKDENQKGTNRNFSYFTPPRRLRGVKTFADDDKGDESLNVIVATAAAAIHKSTPDCALIVPLLYLLQHWLNARTRRTVRGSIRSRNLLDRTELLLLLLLMLSRRVCIY